MTALQFRDAVTIVFLFAGWLGGLLVRAGEPNTTTAATAINALGIELLHRAGPPNANALLSPYSIQSALAMTYAGADGVIRDEMAKVLHYPKDEAEVHRSFAALRKALDEAAQRSARDSAAMKKYGATNDPLTLTVANRLFGQSGYDFRALFLSLVKESYDAPFEAMDFVEGSALATKHINEWVERQTRQRIRDLIPAGALNPLTWLVLVNAIYLKAPWLFPFQESATKPAPFHVNGGKSVAVRMMMQKEEIPYAKGDGFSAVALQYGGYELRLLLFLPDKVNGLATLTEFRIAGRASELAEARRDALPA